MLLEELAVPGAGEDRPPVLLEVHVIVSPEIEDELQVHLEQARYVLGALDVSAHPIQRGGDAREHHVGLGPRGRHLRGCGHLPPSRGRHLPPSMTHVSFEPPPWDELTTSDPFRSATLVRPPGVTTVFSPQSTYGLRSMCRPSNPCSHQVGERESMMGSWAMKLRGLAATLARKSSTSSLVDAGPISIPYPPASFADLTTRPAMFSRMNFRSAGSDARYVATFGRIGSWSR